MGFTIQIEFDKSIAILGNTMNSMFIVLEPWPQNETNTQIPNWSDYEGAEDNGYKDTNFTHLGKKFKNAFETQPTSVKINGKFLKLTLDSYFMDIIRFIKNIHFFYEEKKEDGKIIRADVSEQISGSTSFAISKTTGLVKQEGGELVPKFPFEVEKIVIKDEEPNKIFYFYTSNRTLKIKDGEVIINDGDVDLSDFLTNSFTSADEYFDTNGGAAQTFTLGNGITTGVENGNKFFSLERSPNSQGRVTENTEITVTIPNGGYTTTDQFGFGLEIPESLTIENKIKNPTLHGEITSSIGGQAYIALKMSKDGGNTFLNMVGNDTDDQERTIRHGGESDQSEVEHPIVGDLTVSAGNAYNGLANAPAIDFNFKSDANKAISTIVESDELKVLTGQNGGDVILMRLNRFPRHGITYSIDYKHQLNFASGIFGPNNHGVLKAEANGPNQNPINVSNQLKEVTATVGTLKVYYPGKKPTSFVDPATAADNYSAYYYVDITFQRTGTNGNVDITAKYDFDYNYQEDSGHNIHHGLIINSGSTNPATNNNDGNIYEDITRTRIGNINSEGIFTPVDLINNETGKVLRIEVPVAVTGADYQSRYPYDLDNDGLTKYNLVDNTPTILFKDRREKDEVDGNTNEYYFINVMDSDGNVVSPIENTNLQTDDNWGKDTDLNTPSVSSVEYKVRWDGDGAAWVKELFVTHGHDLQGEGVVDSLALTNAGTLMDILDSVSLDTSDDSILTVAIDSGNDTLLTADVAAGNIKLAYDKPGTSNNLTNWLGFEIEEYTGSDAKTVTLPTGDDANPALPSFSNLNLDLGNITPGNSSFSVPLTWTQTGIDNGISYEVGVSTDGGSTFTELPDDSGITFSSTSDTGATISGLSYDQAYNFRVRASTYENGPYSSSVSLSAQTAPTFTLSSDNKSSETLSVPVISASWNQISGANGYKVEVSENENFDPIYGEREYESNTTSQDIDYLVDPVSDPATNVYFEASTTYYIRVKVDNTNDNSGYNLTSNQVTVVTKSSTPTSLSVSFNRTDRILPALSANWSVVGEADEYRLRLYHKVAGFNNANEEIFLDEWEPFTVNNDPDNVRIEVGNPLDEPTTNSISNVTKYQIYQADGITLNTDRSFISDAAFVNPGGDGNAENLKIVDFAFAVKALHKRADNTEVFFDLYPTYDDVENEFSPVTDTVSNQASTGEYPTRTFQPTITFTTAPTVTESNGGFSIAFKDDIDDATDYKVFVSEDDSFPDNDTNTSELSALTGSPATDFGEFSPGTNTFYHVKYEAGISDAGVITYYPASGNDATYLSLAAAPSFTLAPVHGGSQLEFTGTFPDTNTFNQGHATQGDTGITFDYGFELKAYDTTLNGDNQTGYDSSWTTIPGPQSTSTGGDSIWIYDGTNEEGGYGTDPVIQNLDDNTAYKFRARVETTPTGTGITGGGYSPYSSEEEMMTLPAYFSPPSFNTSSTSHSTTKIPLTITKITDDLPDVNINGAHPEYAYKLEWNTTSNFSGTGSTVTFTNNDFDNFNGDDGYLLGDHGGETLQSNTLYYIGISVTNQNNQGGNTKPFTDRLSNSSVFTLPDDVTNFSASQAETGTNITLTWTNVAGSNNGSTVYKIEVSTDGGGSYTDVDTNISPSENTDYDYAGLSNTNYTFRITASNGSSTSNPPGGNSSGVTTTIHTDNSPPSNISNVEWKYAESTTVIEGEDFGGLAWLAIPSNGLVGPHHNKIKVSFRVEDYNTVSIDGDPTVKIGGNTMTISESGDGATVTDLGNNVYSVEMIYTIPSLGANSNANGLLTFEFTLEDTNGNELEINSDNIGPSSSIGTDNRVITVDTIAPTMTITSSTVTTGSSSSDSEIDLTFTSSEPTNEFVENNISISNGTINNFTTVFEVTVALGTDGNSKYFIDEIETPDLVLKSGNTYRFDQSDSTNGSHPLRFSTTSDGTHATPAGTAYTTGVTVVEPPGQSGSYTEIAITNSTPTLYYYCTQHSGMANDSDITISNSNLTKAKKYAATLTTTASGTYTIDVDANSFRDETGNNNVAATQFSWTYDPPSWSQLGADIDGEAAGDESGYSVAISSDGSIVAVGAIKNDGNGNDSGHVKVYQYNSSNNSWSQLGSNIDGEAAGDQSGFSVSLSNDGSIVAIGARSNDGTAVASDDDRGHVRVYEYKIPSQPEWDIADDEADGYVLKGDDAGNANPTSNTKYWVKLGGDIDGEAYYDEAGSSVSLSSDGATVAIGARRNDDGGMNSGHVRVYEYSSGSWTKLGNNIPGEAAGDQSGYSVSLSSNGSRVAIGARTNDDGGNQSGHVRVYERDPSVTLGWRKLASDIDGDGVGDYSGHSVALSGDGTKVAIGAIYNDDGPSLNSGQVRVYEYNSSNDTWTKLGDDIYGEAGFDQSGYSVSLSNDGAIVAIGAIKNAGGGTDSGHVRVYEWVESTTEGTSSAWVQLGDDIDGEATPGGSQSGHSVAIDASGNTVVIGARYNNAGNASTDNRGHVRVYEYS